MSGGDIKYSVLAQFGPISWCDPDFYPIARQDEQKSADEHWNEITQDTETYNSITSHLGIDPNSNLSAEERLAVYRDWKLLNAVLLTPVGDGLFAFDLITITDPTQGKGIHSVGTVDSAGNITVENQEPSGQRPCPICLARGTLIDTPSGAVRVEELRVGDDVWTVDGDGHRMAEPVALAGSTPVPSTHRVVHLVLDDGREIWISPGHPLPDGRSAGDLAAGDQVDGSVVSNADLVAYDGGATFDILPAGPTGYYWANGILIASTLVN